MENERFDDVAILLHASDDVAVLKRTIAAGTVIGLPTGRITAAQPIACSHKIALHAIARGKEVRKYGQIIGFAKQSISPGEHVHTHNLGVGEYSRDYAFCADTRALACYPGEQMRFFDGHLRPDGRVGTRNYVAVISSVNCSATVCRYVADHFKTPDFRREFPNVDGVLAITHKAGCTTPPGEGQRILQRVLAGFARHPNIFGYVMIGLGCEGNQVSDIRSGYGLNVLHPGEPAAAFMSIQETGGTRKTVEAGVAAIRALLPRANESRRSRQPLSKLMLAENCGGSDGNSGITANPALGTASDELIRFGGTSVLAETPEIYGAEHLLTRRAVSREVGERLLLFIRWWEEHARMHGASIDNNPSPGNKDGGLTTIYEKSLGAVAKGGQAPLSAVYAYAEPIRASGLCFMDTPGFDPVSMTGLVAGGCTIGVFTTGRGSVYGCKPAPCIKISSNTRIYEQMSEDMDINAGTILDGTETVEQVGRRIFEKLVAVAGGERTKSELLGIGDEEFAPWSIGPTF